MNSWNPQTSWHVVYTAAPEPGTLALSSGGAACSCYWPSHTLWPVRPAAGAAAEWNGPGADAWWMPRAHPSASKVARTSCSGIVLWSGTAARGAQGGLRLLSLLAKGCRPGLQAIGSCCSGCSNSGVTCLAVETCVGETSTWRGEDWQTNLSQPCHWLAGALAAHIDA